jgi:hypothetical protein
MEKKFSDLAVGEKFSVNGTEYIKSDEVRISCCRSVNCYATTDASQKGHFSGDTVVVVNG